MGFSARILLDSVSPAGVRLTTMEVTFPRFILSEFNTHRTFCLDGDTKLYFDLPSGPKANRTKRFTMTLREFHEKWHGDEYSSQQLVTAGNHGKTGALMRTSEISRLARWFNSHDEKRRTAQARLNAMLLRSCNEISGGIYHTAVSDVRYSGAKDVYRVTLTDGRQILSSKDHLFLTSDGWQRLEDAVGLRLDENRTATWSKSAQFAVNDGEPQRGFAGLAHVQYVGVRDTYDIEVEGPYHNFVADGFIVHNSRNSASSRAIPTSKLIERVEREPAMPVEWGKNKKGMSADEELDAAAQEEAQKTWLQARDRAVEYAKQFADQHVHKQIANRILEPFMWHTVIVTATEWENFFKLRLAPNAQPEIRVAAGLMRRAFDESMPKALAMEEWHLPLLQDDERHLPIEEQKKISVARCARVSYLTHDGKRSVDADLDLFTRLKEDRHLSPFEHVATPAAVTDFHGNFRGWVQMRKDIEAELPGAIAVEPV